MAVPTLQISSEPAASSSADALIIGILTGEAGAQVAGDDPAFDWINAVLPGIAATGASDELRRLPGPDGGAPVVLIGLGVATPTIEALRAAAGAAARQLVGVESIAFAVPIDSAEAAEAVLEGAGIGAYSYTDYRVTSRESTRTPAATITAHVSSQLIESDAVHRATAIVTAIHTVRDLVNAPPSDLYPATLAAAAVERAAGLPISVEVLDEDGLAEHGFGGILGVGAGSTRPPRLVTLRYSPAGATRHLSLVGKGITFDSGGLSLKPAASMAGMKYDMTGAATVLAVIVAVAQLELPLQLTARLCIAENMPSGSAIRPNDVLRMRGGTTVEVLNTDAEGRLVLADGLVAASEEHPDAIIDVATLTGAARGALGERYIPVMGDDELTASLISAGSEVGETLWRMPLPPELRSSLDSDVADLANGRPANPVGGMLVAAHFLQHFVGRVDDAPTSPRIPWAHLDIAGTASNSGRPYGMIGKGPTGVTVRTLIALSEVFSRP
ncbi:MAG TPA: leucyl aminopeptidase [Pseudolysinimonas sp.]|nr:leucyl aminopeptidase [Pseudolysinimonas sp.]